MGVCDGGQAQPGDQDSERFERPVEAEVDPHLGLATIYGALGEKDSGIAQVGDGLHKSEELLLWLKVDPAFDGLRPDPRFTDLIRRIGFPQS